MNQPDSPIAQFATGVEEAAQRTTDTPVSPPKPRNADERLVYAVRALSDAEAEVERARKHLDKTVRSVYDELGATKIARAWGVTRQAVYNSLKRTES